jgi:hypothetical protein
MVETMAKMASLGRYAREWSPDGNSFITDSWRIWRKDITIICVVFG